MAEVSRYHRVYKLETGETLIYFKHNINNTTEYYVGFIGGAKQDEIPGTTHFLEHMLHQATPNFTVEERAEFCADSCTLSNAYTTEDYLMFFTNVPNSFIDTAMELDAEFLFNKKFKKEDIDNERLAIDEEINSHTSSMSFPLFVSNYQIPTMTGNQILGSHEDIAKIDEKVLQKYIDDHFVSENLVMVVKSNLEFDEVREKFEKYFAHKTPSNKSKRVVIKTPKFFPPQNVMQYQIYNSQKTVSINIAYRTTNNDIENELYAFVLDYIFNNGFHGRLLNKLRTENGLVYSSYYYPMQIIGGMQYDAFEITTSREKVNQTLEAFGQIIKDLCENGITERELQNLKNQILIAEEDRATGEKDIKVSTLLSRYLNNQELFFNHQHHNIKNLTVAEVDNYIKKIFDKKKVMLLMSGDIDFEKLHTDQEILQLFNAHQSKYLYNTISKCLYDCANGNAIPEDVSLELLKNMTKAGYANNVTLITPYDETPQTEIDYTKLSITDRLQLLSEMAKQLGLNLDFGFDLPQQEEDLEEKQEPKTKEKPTHVDTNQGGEDFDEESHTAHKAEIISK